jgi:hypothetical protein
MYREMNLICDELLDKKQLGVDIYKIREVCRG